MHTMTPVSVARRLAYSVIDIAIYTTATLWLASSLGWAPVVQVMQAYSPAQQEQYWNMLLLTLALVALASITAHALRGQSLGKWLISAKTVNLDGSQLGWGGALKRFLAMVCLAALIFIPGPVTGFAAGPGSEIASLILLGLAVVAIPLVAINPQRSSGSPWLQTLFGFKTVKVM
jgi:uncharacterized RDD family membrane protein YckC